MRLYYETIFEWLEKCEGVFGFDLKGYGKIRMYTFLAERFFVVPILKFIGKSKAYFKV